MKRSDINRVIKDMQALIETYRFALPPFAHWTPEEWETLGPEYDEIRDNQLGWDITDFGLGRFEEVGFSLFTVRNGNPHKDIYTKPYAEKLLMMYQGQTAPMHYHWKKMEDIINRGGNTLYITVYCGDEDRNRLDTAVEVVTDGYKRTVPAGTSIALTPGESITIPPYLYHSFQVPKEGGPVLIGEVSMTNDDDNDNCFFEEIGRFPDIIEDEAPYRLLCNEYPPAK